MRQQIPHHSKQFYINGPDQLPIPIVSSSSLSSSKNISKISTSLPISIPSSLSSSSSSRHSDTNYSMTKQKDAADLVSSWFNLPDSHPLSINRNGNGGVRIGGYNMTQQLSTHSSVHPNNHSNSHSTTATTSLSHSNPIHDHSNSRYSFQSKNPHLQKQQHHHQRHHHQEQQRQQQLRQQAEADAKKREADARNAEWEEWENERDIREELIGKFIYVVYL